MYYGILRGTRQGDIPVAFGYRHVKEGAEAVIEEHRMARINLTLESIDPPADTENYRLFNTASEFRVFCRGVRKLRKNI